jgi:hypothetical protein
MRVKRNPKSPQDSKAMSAGRVLRAVLFALNNLQHAERPAGEAWPWKTLFFLIIHSILMIQSFANSIFINPFSPVYLFD